MENRNNLKDSIKKDLDNITNDNDENHILISYHLDKFEHSEMETHGIVKGEKRAKFFKIIEKYNPDDRRETRFYIEPEYLINDDDMINFTVEHVINSEVYL